MALAIKVCMNMVVIGYQLAIILCFVVVRSVEVQTPCVVCTWGNIVFLRPRAFAHSLSVASRTDGGQREIYQFKRSVALNKNR